MAFAKWSIAGAESRVRPGVRSVRVRCGYCIPDTCEQKQEEQRDHGDKEQAAVTGAGRHLSGRLRKSCGMVGWRGDWRAQLGLRNPGPNAPAPSYFTSLLCKQLLKASC